MAAAAFFAADGDAEARGDVRLRDVHRGGAGRRLGERGEVRRDVADGRSDRLGTPGSRRLAHVAAVTADEQDRTIGEGDAEARSRGSGRGAVAVQVPCAGS